METTEQTRNEALKSIIDKLPARRKAVYNIIKSYGKLSNYEIAQKMVLPMNETSGRANELHRVRMIKVSETTTNTRSKKKNVRWEITTPEERDEMLATDRIYYWEKIKELMTDLDYVITETGRNILVKEVEKYNRYIKLIK